MPCRVQVLVLAVLSLLHVFTRTSLGDAGDRRPNRGALPGKSAHEAASVLRRARGSAGLCDRDGFDRCKPVSDSNWNLYGRDSAAGVDCKVDSSLRGQPTKHQDERSHLAVVACGPRLEETLTMLKSAVLLSMKPLHIYIFAEDELHDSFQNTLNSWPRTIQTKFSFTIYPITFPTENEKEWKKLFKPCASQRLFLPLILQEVDSLLYVDTDIIFLQPVEEIWALLSHFNSSQLAAMAPEHEEPRIGWYNRFARHPYYGQTGINSGVMLMNLTRLREKHFKNDMTTILLRWEEILMPLLQKYKLNITWGDQDLLNIIFHHNPESLYVFPCQWNYRPDHCIYGSNCREAEHEGVFILHGNRGVFHDDKQPAFRAVYEAFHKLLRLLQNLTIRDVASLSTAAASLDSKMKYQFSEDMETSLLQPLEASLQATMSTYCGRASHLFTKKLKRSVLSAQQDVTQRCLAESHGDSDSAQVAPEPSSANRGEPAEQGRRF